MVGPEAKVKVYQVGVAQSGLHAVALLVASNVPELFHTSILILAETPSQPESLSFPVVGTTLVAAPAQLADHVCPILMSFVTVELPSRAVLSPMTFSTAIR